MSLFEKAGQKFEETKRSFVSGTEDEYVCRACGEETSANYDECPNCGEDAVEPAE